MLKIVKLLNYDTATQALKLAPQKISRISQEDFHGRTELKFQCSSIIASNLGGKSIHKLFYDNSIILMNFVKLISGIAIKGKSTKETEAESFNERVQ